MCTGLLVAGYVISRFRPRAWKLQIFDVIIGLLWVIVLVVFAFVGCDSKPIYGLQNPENGGDAMYIYSRYSRAHTRVEILSSLSFFLTLTHKAGHPICPV